MEVESLIMQIVIYDAMSSSMQLMVVFLSPEK